QWQDQGLEPLRVSVNVSSLQFKQGNFVKCIELALKDSGLSADYLEIELTESCLMSDVTRNIDVLNEIKKMGIAISIDDFGTGYSSLSYLKKFPIDTLKIDRSFITNVQDRSANDNAGIVTAIMALSHSLRLDVVAEGVETAQELSYLHALGCKTIQGFLFSKPLTVEEFTKIQQDSMHMKKILENVRSELAG
ncbi:MAG: EAL domain-containing protein, partial [Gammaproteobacteria bacterium]|nr:EAL domain-containing protein [Gammaproteobacteria bacterium]